MLNQEPKLLVDFSRAEELERWSAVDDVVMGGRSRSMLIPGDTGTAFFQGSVSAENGGGFASLRSKPRAPGELAANLLVLRARGDGKRYQLRARTAQTRGDQSYLSPFETQAGSWGEYVFSASDFLLTRRGQVQLGAPALDLQQVTDFGLLISDQQLGSFELELAWIGAR